MDLYETEIEEDIDALRRIDARSVDAWMRAAAYAAGDDPEVLLGAPKRELAPPELNLVH